MIKKIKRKENEEYKQIKDLIRTNNNDLSKFMNKSEIEWLNKHFKFINGLLMGNINREEGKYIQFVDTIQNKKDPKTNEEKIYLKFIKYYEDQIKKSKLNFSDSNILFNGMQIAPPGTLEYPQDMSKKLEIEYEHESYVDWVDDWKYR